jgi:hypothetical protein
MNFKQMNFKIIIIIILIIFIIIIIIIININIMLIYDYLFDENKVLKDVLLRIKKKIESLKFNFETFNNHPEIVHSIENELRKVLLIYDTFLMTF